MASTGSAVRPEDVHQWGQQLDEVARRIGARFPRSETRDRVRAYLVGLLGPVQRKNAWQVAEQIGDADPYGVQHLLGRADWDPDAVRDDLRGYVVDFIEIHRWPIFNVADCCLVVGAGMLLVQAFLAPQAKPEEKSDDASAEIERMLKQQK